MKDGRPVSALYRCDVPIFGWKQKRLASVSSASPFFSFVNRRARRTHCRWIIWRAVFVSGGGGSMGGARSGGAVPIRAIVTAPSLLLPPPPPLRGRRPRLPGATEWLDNKLFWPQFCWCQKGRQDDADEDDNLAAGQAARPDLEMARKKYDGRSVGGYDAAARPPAGVSAFPGGRGLFGLACAWAEKLFFRPQKISSGAPRHLLRLGSESVLPGSVAIGRPNLKRCFCERPSHPS